MSLKATGTCEGSGGCGGCAGRHPLPAPFWARLQPPRAVSLTSPHRPRPADLSRTLSYAGAEFALGHVEVDEVFKVGLPAKVPGSVAWGTRRKG